jgi:hypothetical protein
LSQRCSNWFGPDCCAQGKSWGMQPSSACQHTLISHIKSFGLLRFLSQFLPIRDSLKLVFRLVMRGQIGVWTGHHFADNCNVQTIQVHRLRIIQIPNSPGFSNTPFVLVSISSGLWWKPWPWEEKRKNILFQLKQLTQQLGDEKDMQSCNSEACLWTCCKHRSVSPSFFLSQKSKILNKSIIWGRYTHCLIEIYANEFFFPQFTTRESQAIPIFL